MALYHRADFTVDLPRLTTECMALVTRYGIPETGQIGFVNPPGTPADKLMEFSTGKLPEGYRETDFTEFHPEHQGSYLHEVWATLPYRVGRWRIMRVRPRACYSVHRDQTPRCHIALVTTPEALMIFPEKQKVLHIPADGHLYWVNTRQMHTAMNGSLEDRYHLVGCVLPNADT